MKMDGNVQWFLSLEDFLKKKKKMTEFRRELFEGNIALEWTEDANKKKEHISLSGEKHKMKYDFFGTSIVLIH